MAYQTRPPEPQVSKTEVRINRIKRKVSGDPVSSFMWIILSLMFPFLLLGRHVAWELYVILAVLASIKVYQYVNRKRTGADT